MDATALSGGFAQPAIDAAHVFRDVLQAMARPGRIARITGVSPPPGLSLAAAAVLLTLADETTPVHLAGACDSAPIRNYLRFHTGAPITGRADAAFALGNWEALAPLSDYPLGTDAYPDRSATLIVELPALTAMGARLTGPGIRTHAQLSLPEIDPFIANARHFPRGLDFIFTSGTAIAALPRTTRVEAG
ncbi:MAG: alpha-D-ribose 1-methylphosphonate 5-triphosphate synthase subunit PhnH [Saliniramus fredricksonii]|uniref:Alpha-D-ribose 1-methylphosphonate 5-triphosphate synthase subunit PhnH n=1 Tax=Saliniramus fredricksonii TaxID=1653334 RepID=A0A0P7X8Q7_9HYPH|nr:phosphonate C-P lyase system protein PhnH [Saliniramus fredricksonii]KPQ11568.1 MAG: alpha-D-ribose 1-methylphosphonate 5-triphosphate synthase subunit PhnH [Saliniramus fredricksonii]SCC82474.1 alpha-D-ribose 1-methylphosphonate 5-triphosphate synthase subunit PhnH [Saliniramus fredricksonii]